jgi:hypothetical protein
MVDAGEIAARLADQNQFAGHKKGLLPAGCSGRGAALGLEIVVVRAFDEVDARMRRHLRHDHGMLIVPGGAVAIVGVVGIVSRRRSGKHDGANDHPNDDCSYCQHRFRPVTCPPPMCRRLLNGFVLRCRPAASHQPNCRDMLGTGRAAVRLWDQEVFSRRDVLPDLCRGRRVGPVEEHGREMPGALTRGRIDLRHGQS